MGKSAGTDTSIEVEAQPEAVDSCRPARILVVDDDPINIRMVARAIDGMGYTIETASDGIEAVEKARANPPDLMLLDVMMPRMNGIEVCRVIKSFSAESFIPIILVTVKDDVDSKVAGLKLGADDYVAKPYNPLELRARVLSMLRIKAAQDHLSNRRRELESLSVTDDLTGLLNHRAMRQRLHDEFARAQRYSDPLSVLMIDIDNFKDVNDRYGHQFGDRVLSELARVATAAVREIDVVARYGGEEFLVILPQTHFSGSLTVAERVWRSVESHSFDHGGKAVNVTVSIGIAFYPHKNVTSADKLVGLADEALYEAKREGRNRICLHQHVNYVFRPERLST